MSQFVRMRQRFAFLVFSICLLSAPALFAQKSIMRGNVFDKGTGEPIAFASVFIQGTTLGTTTDIEGFYAIANIPAGNFHVVVTFIGYDSTSVDITSGKNSVINKSFYLSENSVSLKEVNISARKEAKRTEVQISKITVTPKLIKSLPSTGGEADIVQYLQVLPGVISSGDQGGQLYIRGGSPIQNKVMLDGMTIYNPFHSIGFYSVFETETIRNVDVYTGGFGAEYGGRISAIVDISTREGNKKRLGGLVSASPFMAKALIEGPIIKLKEEGGGSTSFLFTAKHSYLDQTGKSLYNYAARDSNGLPFNFTDLYGKITLVASNGSKLNVFGFNFADNVNYAGIAKLNWTSGGGGANFTLVPNSANMIIDGLVAYSKYSISLTEYSNKTAVAVAEDPRTSEIKGYTAALNFTSFGANSETKYGFELNGFRTDFQYVNPFKQTFEQYENTTELAGFVKYKLKYRRLVIEPGLRVQSYVSLGDFSLEPRVSLKFNATKYLRFKFAGGLYSQNLISTVNEDDVVNLFVGFLSGPSEQFYKPNSTTEVDSRLQKAIHAIGGVEIDLTDNFEVNVEPYYKNYTQLINLNRNKTLGTDPNYITETGNAYGVDFSFKYETPKLYAWATYSLGYVNRNDGVIEYPTNFDRRHNVNLLVTYNLGKDWDFSARWNYGSGFAFTLTQAFYEYNSFQNGLNTDVLTGNFDIRTILSDQRNSGRLSDYHRLDLSLKKTFHFSKTSKLESLISVTNAYDRKNLFYVDRQKAQDKVYQLPILPSLSLIFSF